MLVSTLTTFQHRLEFQDSHSFMIIGGLFSLLLYYWMHLIFYNHFRFTIFFSMKSAFDCLCRYNKTEHLKAGGPELRSFTHLLVEGKSKYSYSLKHYTTSHQILTSVDSFSHLSFNYQQFPPVKVFYLFK